MEPVRGLGFGALFCGVLELRAGSFEFFGGLWGALAKRGFSAFSDGVFEWFLELRRRSGVFFELQAGEGKWRYRAQERKKERYRV